MSDYVLMNNDTVSFLPTFGLAMVIVGTGVLKGSGKILIDGNKICLEGDEKQVSVSGIYTTSTYIIPGTGTVKIKSLADNHKAQSVFVENKSALLKGGQFPAEFSVIIPARAAPPSGLLDPTTKYTGYGKFLTKDTKWQVR